MADPIKAAVATDVASVETAVKADVSSVTGKVKAFAVKYGIPAAYVAAGLVLGRFA